MQGTLSLMTSKKKGQAETNTFWIRLTAEEMCLKGEKLLFIKVPSTAYLPQGAT